MRVLIVTHFFGPETGAASERIGYFAEFLASKGHSVQVLAPYPSYPQGSVPPEYRGLYQKEIGRSFQILRVYAYASPKRHAVARLLNQYTFSFASHLVQCKLVRPDVVFATTPHLATAAIGARLSRRFGVPLFLDVRDLWPDSAVALGWKERSLPVKLARSLESRVYAKTDFFGVVTAGIRDRLVAKGISPDRIQVLPNGVDIDRFPLNEVQTVKDETRPFLRVTYSGNIGLAQGIKTFLQAAQRTATNPRIVWTICGDGTDRPLVEEYAKRLPNLDYRGLLNRHEIPRLLMESDVGVVLLRRADLFCDALPSKMFEYGAGACCIAVSGAGLAADLVKESQSGFSVDPEDDEGLAALVLSLSENRDAVRQAGRNARRLVESQFQRRTVAAHLEAILSDLAN